MSLLFHILAQLSEYTRPGYWYGLLGIVAFYVVAIFFAALLEKRDTRQYADASLLEPGTPLHPYVAAMNDRAADLGFTYGGTFKHPKFDVQVSLWISDDHLTVIGTGAGTILTRSVRQTDVFTRTSDGVVLDTCDYYGGGDLSGFLKLEQHYHGSLHDLLAMHSKRIARLTAKPVPFVERSPLHAINAIYAERTERLIRRGRARYLGRDERRWR